MIDAGTHNKPLLLITNDDGCSSKGIAALIEVAREFGDVVVMAPQLNASAKGLSLTIDVPLRTYVVKEEPGLIVYACTGTPTDCVKLASENFCPRKPDLVLSGINHGSNASINTVYSATVGAALEAVIGGIPAIAFSLLNHSPKADFSACLPWMRTIIADVLKNGLPKGVALNVNFPNLPVSEIKGIKVVRTAHALWTDSFERHEHPVRQPYWWLTGTFVCDDNKEGTDQWAVENGYVSVVPVKPDITDHDSINLFKQRYE